MRATPTGAFDLFRDELRAGIRTMSDVDELYLAAWCEGWGLQRQREGFPELAAMWFTEAEAHVLNMRRA